MIKIEQAYFGEKNNQHQLLASSINNEDLPSDLLGLTDRPSGLDLTSSYISGYFFEKFYVFMKTMPDNVATRSGLVFSHCLIVKNEDIAEINNLSEIFSAFIDKPIKENLEITSIEIGKISLCSLVKFEQPIAFDSVLKKMIEDVAPVVWIGNKQFEDLIIHLWSKLPYSMRVSFKYRLSESYNDIADRNYNIVYTPEKNANKWTKYKTVGVSSREELQTQGELFLVGKADKSFIDFLELIEIDLKHPSQLKKISECYTLYQSSKLKNVFVVYNQLVRKIGVLAPDVELAQSLKNELLGNLIETISDVQNIVPLRTIKLEPYKQGIELLSDCIDRFIQHQLISSTIDVAGLVDLFVEAQNEDSPLWWREAIKIGISKSFNVLNKFSTSVLFEIWDKDISLVCFLGGYISKSKISESVVLNMINTDLERKLLSEILVLAAANRWNRLHAQCLYYLFSAKEAVSKQVIYDKSTQTDEGLNKIIELIGVNDFIEIAVGSDDVELNKLVSRLCAEHTDLFQLIDINNISWQNAWYKSLLVKNNLESQDLNLRKIINTFLDLIIDGKEYSHQLLYIIANSNHADIYNFYRRADLWRSLPESVVNLFFIKTTIHAISEISIGEGIDFELELNNYIHSAEAQELVESSDSISVLKKLIYFELLGVLNENMIIEYIERKCSIIRKSDAEYIGRLIFDKRWNRAADFLFNNRLNNKHYYAALAYCKSILSIPNSLFYGLNTFTNKNASNKFQVINNRSTIFISYNHKDQSTALKIKSSLENAGFKVIIDKEAMRTGEGIKKFIIRSIEETGVTLSLVSESSLMSAWVAMETIYSELDVDIRGRRFLPCTIDNKLFDRCFPDEAMDAIGREINEIDTIISKRLIHNRGIEDLEHERTRYLDMNRYMTKIISNLKDALCTDLSINNYEEGISKVIRDLNIN